MNELARRAFMGLWLLLSVSSAAATLDIAPRELNLTLLPPGSADLTLQGPADVHSLRFRMPADLHSDEAVLEFNLGHTSSSAAWLDIQLNGTTVQRLRLGARTAAAHLEYLPLPAHRLRKANTLRFILSSDTPAGNGPEVWLGADMRLRLAGSTAPLTLADLPDPLLDRSSATPTLALVLPAPHSAASVEAAAMISGWLGSQSDAPLEVRISDDLPENNAIVLAVNDSLPAGLRQLAAPQASATLIQHPFSAKHTLLVLSGPTAQALRLAAAGLILEDDTKVGTSTAFKDITLPVPRPAYDNPRWLNGERPVPLSALIPADELRQSGSRIKITLPYHVAPDLFHWPDENDSGPLLDLHYRYTSGTAEVLDAHVRQSLPAAPAGGVLLDISRHTQHDCEAANANALDFELLPQSSLSVAGRAHYKAMPDLNIFASHVYPFTIYADLHRSALWLPEQPSTEELSTALTLLARAGQVTGVPGLRLQVQLGGLPGGSKRDWLVLSSRALPAPLDAALRDQLSPGENPWAWLRAHLPWRASSPIAMPSSYEGLIHGMEAPWAKGRSVIVIHASDGATLLKLSRALHAPDTEQSFEGSTGVLTSGAIQTYKSEARYYIGDLPWYIAWRWHLAHRPLWLALLAGLALLILAAHLHQALRRHAQSRLAPQHK